MNKSSLRIGIEIVALVSFLVIGGIVVWQGILFTPAPAPPPLPPVGNGVLTEARHWARMDGETVQCRLCFRKCIIPEGERGFCRVRVNREGTLYTLVYGKTYTWQFAPIEKDGMYHLLPGSRLLAIATASCNFRCSFCHNWALTQVGPEGRSYREWSPEEVVEAAIRDGARAISGTMNEPTIFFEYLYDIARLARERGLKMQFHTNAGISPEPLRELLQHMDGVVVDLKAFTAEFYQGVAFAEMEPVLNTLRIIREEGVWLEIVNLVIPTLNDDMDKIREMCIWIRDNLGTDVPLHFSRFFPNFKLTRLPPTPIETLEQARAIAIEVGLEFVTIGNVPGHEANSTFCPECGETLIKRRHFEVLANHIEDGKCKFCGHQIPGVWE
ncbi:MAG: AmmeMemoRadiSam system radical SAM enzyme [Dehalococcoidia bacterium]|nr:Pyruvate formate-lyase 1-activating enzyme [Bacillota bacterium]MBT9166069.1 Pyruvate formate-lyase 1-activating enzyme [Chloroflexota bacterium]